MNFLKCIPLFLIVLVFGSCDSPKEKQIKEIAKVLKIDHETLYFEEYLSTDSMCLSLLEYDTVAINAAIKINEDKERLKNGLIEFRKLFPASKEELRVWAPTMTKQQNSIYQKLLSLEIAISDSIYKIRNLKENELGNGYIKVRALFSINNDRSIGNLKYGIFCFYNSMGTPPKDTTPLLARYTLLGYKIYDKGKYEKAIPLIQNILKNDYADDIFIPTAESVGLDIVPEDENPKLTRKEREELRNKKWEEYEAKIRNERNVESSVEINRMTAANSADPYVVKRGPVGATYTKEASERFAQYSIHNDTYAIDKMITDGEIIILNEGDIVSMIDIGFMLSKVRTSTGAEVWIDTDLLKKY